MTLQAVAGFLGQSGLQHPALLYRNFAGALAGKRTGAFRYNDFALVPSGSAMSLQIAAGDAVVMGTENTTTQGGYYVWNNTNETLSWPAAAGQPRVDSLILRVIDTDYGVDAAGSKATWEIVSGTPAASPVAVADSAFAPAGAFYHPGAWWRVADFTVPASATNLAAATLDHKRKYARIGRRALVLSTDIPGSPNPGDQITILDGTTPGLTLTYSQGNFVLPETVVPWITFPYAAGWADGSSLITGFAPGYRIVGNKVELRGIIKPSAGGNIASGNQTVGTLPAGARPSATFADLGVAQWGSTLPIVRREVTTGTGTVVLNCPYTSSWASLDGMFYYLT